VHFVEKERKAAAIIRRNLTQLGIGKEKTEAAVIHETPAAAALRRLSESGTRFALIFLDPPYALEREYRQTLEKIAASSLLAEGGLAVAEHEKFYDPGAEFGGLRRFRLLTQGNSCLSFYRLHRFSAGITMAESFSARGGRTHGSAGPGTVMLSVPQGAGLTKVILPRIVCRYTYSFSGKTRSHPYESGRNLYHGSGDSAHDGIGGRRHRGDDPSRDRRHRHS
jgi:hypothetical protein